jgi:hypothetical protein
MLVKGRRKKFDVIERKNYREGFEQRQDLAIAQRMGGTYHTQQ